MPSRADVEAQKEKAVYDAIHTLERRIDKAWFVLNIIIWLAASAGGVLVYAAITHLLKK